MIGFDANSESETKIFDLFKILWVYNIKKSLHRLFWSTINERIEYVMDITFYCDPMLRVNAATLKNIGAKKDEDSDNDCNVWLCIFVACLFLKLIYLYFGEEMISNT